MAKREAFVDAYIAAAAPFAQPILTHLRTLIHRACPAVREGHKWHLISFEGNGIICMIAAFKNHCSLVFWKSSAVLSPAEALSLRKLTSVGDLPAQATLSAWIRTAARLDQDGSKRTAVKAPKNPPALRMPDDLRKALAGDRAATDHFAAFPPGAKRDYITWIVESKRPETRMKRLATSLSWIAQGKRRNWKYEAKRPRASTTT